MGENGKGDGFNVKASSRAKRRCQLIVRLKAIKYKEDISSLFIFLHQPPGSAPASANSLTFTASDF